MFAAVVARVGAGRAAAVVSGAGNGGLGFGLQQRRGVKTIDFAGHKEKVFGEV